MGKVSCGRLCPVGSNRESKPIPSAQLPSEPKQSYFRICKPNSHNLLNTPGAGPIPRCSLRAALPELILKLFSISLAKTLS